MMLSLDTAYRSFSGEVEASSTPTICRLSDSSRHQLSAIALRAFLRLLVVAQIAARLPDDTPSATTESEGRTAAPRTAACVLRSDTLALGYVRRAKEPQ